MLSLKPSCEHCDRDLPVDAVDARICSFECTFCATCADEILHNVCPNCGGGLEKRPIRPRARREKFPPSAERVYKPADLDKHAELVARLGHLAPERR